MATDAMTDAGEKLEQRTELDCPARPKGAIKHSCVLCMNAARVVRAELERAAEIADECGTVTFNEEAFEIAAAIRRRKV